MEKDTSKDIILKSTEKQGISGPLRFFSDDSSFVFVFKKTQKLVSALYLISGFFQDDEPIKWKLRSLGSKLLSSSILLKDGASSQRDRAVIDMRGYVLEVTALFAVAKQAGMISDMNFEIVNKEFSLLLDTISLSGESYGEETSDLKSGFFHVEAPESIPQRTESVSSADSQPKVELTSPQTETIKDKTTSVLEPVPEVKEIHAPVGYLEYRELTPHTRALESLKGQSSYANTFNEPQKRAEPKDLKEYGAVAVKKNSRQSIIINLLKRKREIMIKDVSPLIEGCSEKTIQRELLAMVHLGILRKEGEKRWSKYSLLKP